MRLKFDTRDRKPKLYNILILSIAAAAVLGIMAYAGGDSKDAWMSAVFTVYAAIVLVLLLLAYFKQLQYNPYSYNTILYMGFALFVLSVFITHLILTMNMFRTPQEYSLTGIFSMLMNSAKNYMLLSFPFILGFSVLLFISNISLMRHEGKRPVHALGILASVIMVGTELLLYRADYYVSGSIREVMMHDLFTNLIAAVYLYFECMLIGAVIASLLVIKYKPEYDKDFMIILGCGIRKDGTPSPLLAGRIDRAIGFYKEQKARTGKELIFITSGGQGRNEVISESASMKNYLIGKGIPARLIIEEDRSTDTLENMRLSKEKINETMASKGSEAGTGVKIAFATTNYHVFRSGLCARRMKMRAVGIGARTRWYFWPNAWLREFAGLVSAHRGKQAFVLAGLIVSYTVLTLVVYR